MFENNIEYGVSNLESTEAKVFIVGKYVHVYSASCSCPGNNIKIDETGHITGCDIDENNEYFYTITNGEGIENKFTTRSSFIKFMILDENVTE